MDAAEFEAALLDGQELIDLQDIYERLSRWQVLRDAIACGRTSIEVSLQVFSDYLRLSEDYAMAVLEALESSRRVRFRYQAWTCFRDGRTECKEFVCIEFEYPDVY
jgi:hypothetical protein